MNHNRIFQIHQELRPNSKSAKRKLVRQRTKAVTKTPSVYARAKTENEFILDVLQYFFRERLNKDELSTELKLFAAKLVYDLFVQSALMDLVKGEKSHQPKLAWMISDRTQIAFYKRVRARVFNKKMVEEIGVRQRAKFKSILEKDRMVQTKSYTEGFSDGSKKALVVFVENTGALPFQWPSVIPDKVKDGIEFVVDYLAEEISKLINNFKGAEGKQYQKVVMLEDSTATYAQLKSTLQDLGRKGYIIDVFTLTHGSRSSFSGYKGASISDKDIRNLTNGYDGKLPLRAVYMMNCYGWHLADDWIAAGAQAAAGAKDINYIPEPMMSKVWSKWKKGGSLEDVVNQSFNESKNLFISAIDKTIGRIPFKGSSWASALKAKIGPYLADSQPFVLGNKKVNINSVPASTAHSLEFTYVDESEAMYDTGEHVLTGEVSVTGMDKAHEFKINTVPFTYGELIAMGDFYATYNDMAKAPVSELQKLQKLIRKSRKYYAPIMSGGSKSGSSPGEADWSAATGGRYLKLAQENFGHFAPSSFLIPSFSSSKKNHKSEFQLYHASALKEAASGSNSDDLDFAMTINAFGCHFLTDAFSAGHLFNKDDLNRFFKKRVKGNEAKLFDAVAKLAFKGKLKKDFSKWETAKKVYWINWDIDDAGTFSKLLQGIHKEEPDLIGKTVIAKLVHDDLNNYPGGMPVTNGKGKSWNLSGDGTMNKANMTAIHEAVKESINNVINQVSTPVSTAAAMAKVWAHIPRPTASAVKTIKLLIDSYTDAGSKNLHRSFAKLLAHHYKEILRELVKRGKLKPASWF